VADELAAAPAGERVAVVDARFVGHTHSLRLALTDPRFPAGAVPGAVTVQAEARPALARVLATLATDAEAAASGTARQRSGTPGAAGGSRRAAQVAAHAVADSAKTGAGVTSRPETAGEATAAPEGAATSADAGTDTPGCAAPARTGMAEAAAGLQALPDRIAAGLDAEGVEVHRPELGVLVARVPADDAARAAARAEVDGVDDEAVRLRSAVKSRDGFFTTFFISPYSRYLARWCARRGLSPNQVTSASLLVALIAAGCAATGTRGGFVAAGVLLLASFVLDCTDGQLARYSLQYSTLGAWLDATFDRAKEYAYYAGLALGAARGGDDVWALALGAMVLQTVRHVVDFSFTEANHDAAANTSPTAALSDRLDSVGWTVWARRMVVLPIGERWALIAVLTACTTPRITLAVLLIGCALAACYTTAGRVLRSLTRKAERTDRAARALADLADSGPLAEAVARAGRRFLPPVTAAAGAAAVVAVALWTPYGSWWPVLAAACYAVTSGLAVSGPLKGALDWLVPPLLRAAEYGTVLVLAARSAQHGALPAAFGLVAAVAYHHYDTVYRIRGGTGAPPHALVRAIGGHEGRILLVTVLAALLSTGSGFPLALAALAGVLALAVLGESIRFWVSSAAPAVHDETGEPA
jgi:phosphatidylglycerophosphate synthase